MYLRWLGQPAANAAEAAPAEVDALAERLLAAFTAQPVSVDDVLVHAVSISPPPFDIPALRVTRRLDGRSPFVAFGPHRRSQPTEAWLDGALVSGGVRGGGRRGRG